MGDALSVNEPDTVKSRINELRDEKAKLGRSVAEAKTRGDSIDDLVGNLKTVSDEIKYLQKVLKQALGGNAKAEQRAWKPGTPEIPETILSKKPGQFTVCSYPEEPPVKADIDDYVTGHPAGSVWHTTTTLDFIAQTYGHACRLLVARNDDGKVVGILPLVQQASRLFGNLVISSPYFNYGGVLADHPDVANALLESANQWRAKIGARSIELRHVLASGLELPRRQDKLTFWLPLPDSADALWTSFQPKVRAQIRRGEKEGIESVIGGTDLLTDFYQVFARNMRDLGTPVYGKSFFQNLLDLHGDKARLVITRMNGKAIGCAFIIGFGGRMEIPWASTLREYNQSGVNMLMYWKILEFSVNQGFKVFDFGRCSKDAGTYKFKQQWGATPVQLNWEYLLQEGEPLPALNPNNPKFRLMIAVWKRMPVWLSRVIGPSVVKYLP